VWAVAGYVLTNNALSLTALVIGDCLKFHSSFQTKAIASIPMNNSNFVVISTGVFTGAIVAIKWPDYVHEIAYHCKN